MTFQGPPRNGSLVMNELISEHLQRNIGQGLLNNPRLLDRMSTWTCTCLLKVTGRHSKRCCKIQEATRQEREERHAYEEYKALWKWEMHLRTELWLWQQQQQQQQQQQLQQQELFVQTLWEIQRQMLRSSFRAQVKKQKEKKELQEQQQEQEELQKKKQHKIDGEAQIADPEKMPIDQKFKKILYFI